MFNKCIRVDLPIVTVSINDVPEEACKGFEILAFAAAVLVDYIVSHQKEFDHYNKFANRDRIKTVLNNNISVLKEKLCSKEIVFQKPDGAYIKNVESLQNNCPYAVLETAVSIAEEYRQKNNAYFGFRKTLPKPDIPTLDDCKSFKVRSMAELVRTKRIGLPFVVNGRLCVKEIELTLIENELLNCKNININDSYIVARNDKVMLEVHPIKFISKPFNYSLHDIVVMGVDLGTINDASCAIYNNQTGKVTGSIVQIPEKTEIKKLQSDYKRADAKTRTELELRINDLKSSIEVSSRAVYVEGNNVIFFSRHQAIEDIYVMFWRIYLIGQPNVKKILLKGDFCDMLVRKVTRAINLYFLHDRTFFSILYEKRRYQKMNVTINCP